MDVAQRQNLTIVFFQLKDGEGHKSFLEETSSSTSALASSFSDNRTFPHNANVFFKNLNGCIQKCFKKVRIRGNGKVGSDKISSLLEEKLKLKRKLKLLSENCTNLKERSYGRQIE
jgi:hypothetical protein